MLADQKALLYQTNGLQPATAAIVSQMSSKDELFALVAPGTKCDRLGYLEPVWALKASQYKAAWNEMAGMACRYTRARDTALKLRMGLSPTRNKLRTRRILR